MKILSTVININEIYRYFILREIFGAYEYIINIKQRKMFFNRRIKKSLPKFQEGLHNIYKFYRL